MKIWCRILMSNPRLRTKFRAERNVPMSFIWHHCWFAECRSLSMGPAFLYLCISVPLYFCISGLAPLLMCWSFCRFSVWGPEVRLSCRDGWQGGSLGGRRLRRGPGGHLSWGEILVATCLEVRFLSTISSSNARMQKTCQIIEGLFWAIFTCPMCIWPIF